jgi:hypothetical protein
LGRREMALTENDDGFKYDLATQLNDHLRDRYRTFLYSRAQEQLVGTDGERTFNAVFEKEARIVAVLLRPEWGHTPWTRIEETAIRNRARPRIRFHDVYRDESWDFDSQLAAQDTYLVQP